jgi:hypothetical protein
MRYRLDVGTIIKFDKSRQQSKILWTGKKDKTGCFNHYLIPIDEDKVQVLDEYFARKFLVHKHGTWH